ncbi:MAG: 16S rRNA (cytidine(1402)-2'-O)-methyltransferase [Clostridiales bacterium]|nr:16S rRNA (cytidine(1402)-2'-O)-methyltransferase [Clostridiales bacterium]
MSGKLYVVATPIGNASDITLRAIDVLGSVDLIAAEDTRTSAQLLAMHNIHTKTAAYHKFNETQSVDRFISLLLDGSDIALITDAGTPCISDPGYVLIDKAVQEGIPVIGISGPCAAITALSVSGFNTVSFSFYGFLPRGKKDLADVLMRVKTEYSPVTVFYESPKRIMSTMQLLSEIMPSYDICLCNDLTKLFERIYRGKPFEILNELRNNANAQKGEYTLILRRTEIMETKTEEDISVEAKLLDTMLKESCTLKDAVSICGKDKNRSKNEVYAASLRLKELLKSIGSSEWE